MGGGSGGGGERVLYIYTRRGVGEERRRIGVELFG